MIINVKYYGGELEVEGLSATDSVFSLILRILCMLGNNSCGKEYDLYFAGKIINTGTLVENGLKSHCTVKLIEAPMRIKVQCEGITKDISFANDGCVTVGEVKMKVRESFHLIESYFENCLPGLKLGDVLLVGNNKSIINAYNVKTGDTLTTYKVESPKEEDTVATNSNNSPGSNLSPIPESPKELRKLDLVISCDTSGSLGINFKDNIEIDKLITRISKDIPDLRIGLIVHGDYTDYKSHATHALDLSNDFKHLNKYVENTKPANPKSSVNIPSAAYALALREARLMSWRDGPKVLVVIGGGVPHPPSYTVPKISWWDELDCLVNLGVKVYSLRHAVSDYSQPFYQEISERTGGTLVDIHQFDVISPTLAAIAYRETTYRRLSALKEEIETDKKDRKDVEAIFSILTKPFAEKEKNTNWKRDNKSFEAWYDTNADAEFVHPWFALNVDNHKWQHLASTFDPHDSVPHVKVVVLGDQGVGKKVMLISLTAKAYPESIVPSVACDDEFSYQVEIETKKFNTSIFVGSSQDQSKMREALYPQTDIFVVCFSVGSPPSLIHAESKWAREVSHQYRHVPILLVGTKAELREDPVVLSGLHLQGQTPVSYEEGIKAAKSMGAAGYMEVSAKNQQGLHEVFDRSVRIVLENFANRSHHNRKSCIVM